MTKTMSNPVAVAEWRSVGVWRRFFLGALAVSAAFLFPLVLGAQTPEQVRMADPSSIVVSGTGESAGVPDEARILFWVETRSETATAAASENARLQEAVILALRGAGIESRDITTTGYSLNPDMQYDERDRRSRLVGYVARNGVSVRVREIAKVGPLIDAAIGAGANGVGGLSFASSREAELRREALTLAVGNACRDAEVMARAAGGSLGRVLEMSSGGNYAPPRPEMFRAMASAAQDAATPIEAGELAMSAQVTVRWEYLPTMSGESRCGG
ncbi:MAG TPA: SIMPL domain-containing protein [Gemmatimonadales bacterium]|nr:SIMPL domain-containing protein [Gemmatimonadales bacterium]